MSRQSLLSSGPCNWTCLLLLLPLVTVHLNNTHLNNVSPHTHPVTRRLWVNDAQVIPFSREKSKRSQVPWPASHWIYKPGSWVRQGSSSQRLHSLRYHLLLLEPRVRQVVSVASVRAVYQAGNLMGWQKACFECRESSLLFRSMEWNIQTFGKHFGRGQGQRREGIHRSIHISGNFIPNTQVCKVKDTRIHWFVLSFIILRVPFGTILYFLPSALEKVLPASKLTQYLAPMAGLSTCSYVIFILMA